MSQMILKGIEIVRINPSKKTKIEYLTNDGRSVILRYNSNACGDFNGLTDNGKEIIGMTSKGLYYYTT
jgi:hypothetical protein